MLQHCWKILKFSEKWKLRDQEGVPRRGSLFKKKDDEDSDDAPKGERNKDKPDGRRMEKDPTKRSLVASTLRD